MILRILLSIIEFSLAAGGIHLYPPLHLACIFAKHALELLLSCAETDVNLRMLGTGETPAMTACRATTLSTECFELLNQRFLELDLDITANDGRTTQQRINALTTNDLKTTKNARSLSCHPPPPPPTVRGGGKMMSRGPRSVGKSMWVVEIGAELELKKRSGSDSRDELPSGPVFWRPCYVGAAAFRAWRRRNGTLFFSGAAAAAPAWGSTKFAPRATSWLWADTPGPDERQRRSGWRWRSWRWWSRIRGWIRAHGPAGLTGRGIRIESPSPIFQRRGQCQPFGPVPIRPALSKLSNFSPDPGPFCSCSCSFGPG